jgi:NodT family efflux transporter outer membrane factor (OMF) lipoprotein
MPITTSQNDFSLKLAVNYEVDLFDRVKNNVKVAEASKEQLEAEYENIRLLLASEIASDYFALRELDGEIEIVIKSIELQKKALVFIKARYDLGLANGVELSQQQNQLDSSLSQLDILNNQRSQLEHALAFLTGSFANDFHIVKNSFSNALPLIPASVPSDVLQQRPDVAAAERSMAQANAQIGVARAAFFPTINLAPFVGEESASLSTITNSSSFLWSLGVSATQPLFNAGKIKAGVKISEINYQSSIEYYRQTVLAAIQEVENGLTGTVLLSRAETNINTSIKSAKQSIHLTNVRYEGGLGIYLDVINAEQVLLTEQRLKIQNKGQQFQVAVYLVKALGGKWDANL